MRQQPSEHTGRPQFPGRLLAAIDGLQALLWGIWTLAVATTAYISWHADMLAQRPLNLLGLVVHCGVAGVVGLVVLTLLEMWLRPWLFAR
ncbi:MAG TPA: hypothetical protein PLO33_00920 [Kouleothrix sp.]|uniref:hypothetical protein n=1 Tax=Kouleothrix sp. TaxID=2779161 RepID=UPI002C265D95|nr:hypothetical protein [Kouleothrix sp.]HRC74204.1 hypothetical protein [Kouleothrix sp.]